MYEPRISVKAVWVVSLLPGQRSTGRGAHSGLYLDTRAAGMARDMVMSVHKF